LNQTTTEVPGPRRRSAEFFEKANAEYDSANFSKALELFDSAILCGLQNEVVYNNKGASLDALGRNAEAVKCYKRATLLNKEYELAWHNLGNSLYMRESFKDAARAYFKAATLKPDRMENWTGLAASYTKLGRYGKAKEAIGALSGFAREDPSVLLLQSDMYLEAGLTEESMERCREFIVRRPDSVEGLARLGSTQHEMAEYGKAIDTFEAALKIDPRNKELWNNIGYTCFCAGFLERAIQCFDKAIEIDPNYKHAWYNKGYAYHGADLLEDAVRCYQKAIGLDPCDRVLWNNLGNAMYNLGRYADSVPKFVEAIKVDPDYEIAWNNIGNALEKMGLHKEAIPFHERSLEIRPDFDYALYAKGVCRSLTGDPEGGYDLVLESLDLNPSYDEAWKARSKIATQMGRFDEALISIEEALALNPQYDQGWAERGEILLAVGESEAAQASFEMALRCLEDPHTETVGGMSALVRRGVILARLGRYDEALANLETVALTGNSHSSTIPRVLELRRFLNRWDLPPSLKEIAEKSDDQSVRIALVNFLIDKGDWQAAEEVLSTIEHADDAAELQILKSKVRVLLGGQVDPSKLARIAREDGTRATLERFEAEVHEARGNLRQAVSAYGRALELSPSDRLAALGLARVRLRSKDAKKAISAADLALGIDPKDWEAHRIKADAYEILGDHEKAAREVGHAKDLLVRIGFGKENTRGGTT
jgi:tetratricopeptide (TPR) repeat protein